MKIYIQADRLSDDEVLVDTDKLPEAVKEAAMVFGIVAKVLDATAGSADPQYSAENAIQSMEAGKFLTYKRRVRFEK